MMATQNPYYYGLVKQIGPWKTTRPDILRGQAYKYTPNEQTENPYTVKSANSQLYEQYSSQGLIYDARTSPVVTVKGKLRRGKVVRAKKVIEIVDTSGNIVSPTDNYFLNRYMGEMRGSVQNDISVASLGSATDVSMMTSYRASTATMATGSTNTSAISIDSLGLANDPAFEGLNMEGPRVDEQDDLVAEEMVDRGAQNGDRVLNDQIEFVQNLERERIYAFPNVTRDRWENNNSVFDYLDDRDYLESGEQLPMFTEETIMDLDPPLPGYQRRRRRSSFELPVASTNNPRPRQRPRQRRMDLEPTLPGYQSRRRSASPNSRPIQRRR